MSGVARFELDAGVRRRDGGRLLFGGTPPRLVRLSDAGNLALGDILAGSPLDRAASLLAKRLQRDGLLHPLPDDGGNDPPVTIVVPVRDGGEPLAALVRALAAEGPVIVVDDGSGDGSGERAAAAGARVIPNDGPRGPAAARNTGLRAAATELVAFVDADCEVRRGWRAGLAALLAADPRLALAAPRVRSVTTDTSIGRYESRFSPLDLGPAASLVGPRRRIAYLPAAALVARREALLAVGGFDRRLRFGEDVDLVWRLLAAGWSARYVPARELHHRPRSTVVALASQRCGYGSSAPGLVDRHGVAAAPLRSGRHGVGIGLATAVLGPRTLLPAVAASAALVAAKGRDRASRQALAEVALRADVDLARHLARALLREWLPLTLASALARRRGRRLLLAALVVDTLPIWLRARRTDELLELTALQLVDRVAYATGLWREMAVRRDFRALLPRGAG